MLQNNKLSLNYEIIGKLIDLGYIEHKIFISCKHQEPPTKIVKKTIKNTAVREALSVSKDDESTEGIEKEDKYYNSS